MSGQGVDRLRYVVLGKGGKGVGKGGKGGQGLMGLKFVYSESKRVCFARDIDSAMCFDCEKLQNNKLQFCLLGYPAALMKWFILYQRTLFSFFTCGHRLTSSRKLSKINMSTHHQPLPPLPKGGVASHSGKHHQETIFQEFIAKPNSKQTLRRSRPQCKIHDTNTKL